MNGTASLLLLFVAAGLLLLAGMGIGYWRGRPPSAGETALMALMTGVAIMFLFVVMPVIPIVLFPFVVAGMLLADWIRKRSWLPLGAFLVGSGSLLFAMQAMSLANDLADAAVTIPGWSPIPMAVGAALAVIGATLIALHPTPTTRER